MAQFRIIAGGLIFAYTFILAFGSREGFPSSLSTGANFPFLSDQPVGEDGYYLMLAAWNLGAGQGLSANFGEIITGVQPLMTVVLAGLARIVQTFGGDKFDFARAMIVFGGLNAIVFAALCARIARLATPKDGDDETSATMAFLIGGLSFYLFRTFTYGLETGLYLALLAYLIARSLELMPLGRRLTGEAALRLGLAIGLCGLARIDFGIVAALAFLILILVGRVDFSRAVLAGLVALAVTSPWFFWVRAVSGTFMPTSGPAQASMVDASSAPGRAEAMIAAVFQNLAPWLPTAGNIMIGFAGVAAIAVIALIAVRRGMGFQRGAGSVLAAWAIGMAVLPFLYFAFFWAGHFYARYTAPLVMAGVLIPAVAFAFLPARMRSQSVALAFGAFVIVNAVAAWQTHHRGEIGDGHSVAAGYVAREIPATAKVGAFQSGVVGFYNANVINLDGKVNQAALLALREKRVEEYLDRAGIDYVIDWEGVIKGLMPRAMESGQWVRCPRPVGNLETICVMRRKLAMIQDK